MDSEQQLEVMERLVVHYTPLATSLGITICSSNETLRIDAAQFVLVFLTYDEDNLIVESFGFSPDHEVGYDILLIELKEPILPEQSTQDYIRENFCPKPIDYLE